MLESLNPWKGYKLNPRSIHSHIIIMRKMADRFIELYRDVLEIAGKLESEDKELHKIMVAMKKQPKKIRKKGFSKAELRDVVKLFDKADKFLEDMIYSLEKQQFSDLTVLYHEVRSLLNLSNHVKLSNLPDEVKNEWGFHIYEIASDVRHVVRHSWVIAKAQARDFTKLEEAIDPRTTKGNRRRIRKETIELGHVDNRIDKLEPEIIKLMHSGKEPHKLTQEFEDLVKGYHEEVKLLEHIMHQSKILIHVTEHKVLHHLKIEAEKLDQTILLKRVRSVERHFKKVARKIENHTRRATMDIEKGILPKISRGTGHLSGWDKFRIWFTELFNPPKPAEEYK